MLIDTHAHLNFNAFKEDCDEVIKRTLTGNIWFVNVGTKYETSKKAVELAQKYDKGVFAAVGLHPMYAAAEFVKLKTDLNEGNFLIKEQNFNKEKYQELAKFKKVVAVGEIGLDYYYRPKGAEKLVGFKEKQKKVFLEQLDLAKELNLPVILHCRLAHQDMIDILERGKYLFSRGVVHCWTGSWEQSEKFLAMGFYLGFNGIIFKNIAGINFEENIRKTPLDRILLETDCPYLTPIQAGAERNEPLFLKYVAKKIANIKKVSFEEICQITTDNARKLFNI